MLPEQVYKRRHFGTPWLFTLFVVNAIATCLVMPAVGHCDHISWLFWVFVGGLAAYNFYTIRRNREDFNKVSIISYIIFMLLILGGILYFLFPNGCNPTA